MRYRIGIGLNGEKGGFFEVELINEVSLKRARKKNGKHKSLKVIIPNWQIVNFPILHDYWINSFGNTS
jgi:hypothetical protein